MTTLMLRGMKLDAALTHCQPFIYCRQAEVFLPLVQALGDFRHSALGIKGVRTASVHPWYKQGE